MCIASVNSTQYSLCSLRFTGTYLWQLLPCSFTSTTSLGLFRKFLNSLGLITLLLNPLIPRLEPWVTIRWKTVEQYLLWSCLLFNFDKFAILKQIINFELGPVRSERVNNII